MKKDIVNLSKEEYEYLKSIDLNLTKETGIYFDYDLIMANIDKTPREIIQMDDTIDRRFLSWFDKLFASNLENFLEIIIKLILVVIKHQVMKNVH